MTETLAETFQTHLSRARARELETPTILGEIEAHIAHMPEIVNTCKISSMIYRIKHANHLIGILTQRRFEGTISEREYSELKRLQNIMATAEHEIEHKCNCSLK